MEYNTQKYKFNQDGQDYVVSTGLVNNKIRITCQENLALDGPFYSNEFTLEDLRNANQFFMLPQNPEEALEEINKGIERQKAGLSRGMNDTMLFIGYVVIGTDNDSYNLPLRRDYEPNKYGIFTPPKSSAADLVLESNYQIDGGRLNAAETNNGNLQREQTELEEELNRIIPEINKLRKISLDIKEENALIKERLKILQEQLEERKRSVFKLKEENENLKRENQELTNYIKNQENLIRERQALQTTIKVKQRPNISHGKSAVTSKFEQSALRTFIPRTVAKPITEDYIQKKEISAQKANVISPAVINTQPKPQYIIPASNQKTLETKYLPTIYRPEKIISQAPVVVQEEHPDVTYSTKPNIGDDMEFSAKQYVTSNAVYTYKNLPENPHINKAITYGGKINDKSYSSHYVTNKDMPYTSAKARDQDMPYTSTKATNQDMPYTSAKTIDQDMPYTSSGKSNKDIPYSSSGARNIPYSSSGKRNNDLGYSSSGRRNKDTTYTSTRIKDKEKDIPYTSTRTRNNDNPYSSSGRSNKDVPYTSQMSRGINKGIGYTSTQANKKDSGYGSKISNNSNIEGYSSQMANNLGDSTNAGYSSQMAKTTEKYIQGNTNKRPKGSRAPNSSHSNYNKPKGSRAPNFGNINNNDEPDIGYSSYK